MPSQGTEPRPAGARLTSMRHVCHRQSCSKAPETERSGACWVGSAFPERTSPWVELRRESSEVETTEPVLVGTIKEKTDGKGEGSGRGWPLEDLGGPLEAQEPREGLQVESGVIQPAPLWIPAPHGYHFGCCAEDARGQVGTGHR